MSWTAKLAWIAAVTALLFSVLAVSVMTGEISGFDTAIRNKLHSFVSPSLTDVALVVSFFGTLGVLGVLGLVVFFILERAGRRRDIVVLIAVMVGALVLENLLKFSFQRTRPPVFFGPSPLSYSFPSGHALFSLCFYGASSVIAARSAASELGRFAIWSATALIVLAIGATRIYLGVHYPSDVLGGYLVAMFWLAVVLNVEQLMGHAPTITSAGARKSSASLRAHDQQHRTKH